MEIIKSENDFYTSVEKAFDEIDLNWRKYKGVIAVGSHTPKEIESKIEAISNARRKDVPFLGICFGMQLAAIEYARNVSHISDGNTEELSGKSDDIITKLPRLRVGMHSVDSWWASQGESHWHNYAFNPKHKDDFESDWDFAYGANDTSVVEIMRLKNHRFFVGVQFHPEYQSSKDRPHPLLLDFLNVCRNK